MSIHLSTPYKTRAIRFLDLWQQQGWKLKVYGIAFQGERPREALLRAAQAVISKALPEIPTESEHYNVGWVTVHDARGGVFVVLDWWGGENMIFQRLWIGPGDQPDLLTPGNLESPISCIWELYIAAFERIAWIHSVLANQSGQDLDVYLQTRLSEDI